MSDERHLPKLAALCQSIGDMIAGGAAQILLDQGPTFTGEIGAVIVLPSWVWRLPAIDVGRKGRSATGELQTMPARIVWPSSPVLVVEQSAATELQWKITGLGHNEEGTTTVLQSGDTGVQLAPQPNEDMSPFMRPFSSIRQRDRILRDVVKSGEHARWQIVTSLEAFTMTKLADANSRVAAELGGHRNYAVPAVLDEISLDELLGNMLFGEGGTSVVSRMIDRSLNPNTFQRVDPMRYFAVSIRSRSEEAVRQKIGDPKVGPKVRRILEKSGATTIDELIVAYRAAFPSDSLARKRAIAALTSGPEIAAAQRIFDEERTQGMTDQEDAA